MILISYILFYLHPHQRVSLFNFSFVNLIMTKTYLSGSLVDVSLTTDEVVSPLTTYLSH